MGTPPPKKTPERVASDTDSEKEPEKEPQKELTPAEAVRNQWIPGKQPDIPKVELFFVVI